MADFEHVITTGQSLSIGSQGLPGFSLASEAANSYRVAVSSGAAVAHTLNSTAENQRPDLSMGYRIAQHTPAQDFGFSTHGISNTTIAQLSKGGSTGKYEEAIGSITARNATVTGAGDTYRVRAIHWIQGEADRPIATTRAEYTAALLALRTSYATDIAAITGQAWQPPVLSGQPATWNAGVNPPKIELAIVDAHRLNAGVYVIGAQYHLEYADSLHLTARGYYHLGELHARAHNALFDTGSWNPVMPSGCTVTGNQVVVKFHVPAPPLVFDTTLMAAVPNMGFALTGTSATITGVAITAPDEVTLTTSAELGGGAYVTYGLTETTDTNKTWGNLRDSETQVSAYDSYPLHNWSVQFSDPVTAEGSQVPPYAFNISDMFRVGGGGALYRMTPDS